MTHPISIIFRIQVRGDDEQVTRAYDLSFGVNAVLQGREVPHLGGTC